MQISSAGTLKTKHPSLESGALTTGTAATLADPKIVEAGGGHLQEKPGKWRSFLRRREGSKGGEKVPSIKFDSTCDRKQLK